LSEHCCRKTTDVIEKYALFSKFRELEPAGQVARYLTASVFSMPSGGPMLIGALVTFLVVILILYLINLLPIDGRAKQICRVVVIILGVISLLKYIAVF
jgi:hypothetical protein